jgi:hypothetical protein
VHFDSPVVIDESEIAKYVHKEADARPCRSDHLCERFPGDRNGKIKVDNRSSGPNRTPSVTDNGVGMPADAVAAKPGLGTSIIEALARQMRAIIKVNDSKPGTAVSLAHTQFVANAAPTERAV